MNKNFWNKILCGAKNVSNRVSDYCRNSLLPILKKIYNISIEKSKVFIIRVSDFIKNIVVPYSIKIFNYVKIKSTAALKKLTLFISDFYKNHFIPFTKKNISTLKEFYRLALLNAGDDNKELTKIFSVSFSILSLHLGKAGKKIIKYFSSGKNLIYYIRYLSYRRLVLYTVIFITFDVFLIWFGSYRILYAKHYWEGQPDKKFFIRPGKSLDEIIGDLKDNDILKSKIIFKIYVKLSGKENQIISRRYLFLNGISNSELLNTLTDKNMVQMEKFTLIEGLRIKQIAKIVENKLQLSQEKFIRETENDSLINILGLKGKIKNLEGFLFPDTYYLPLDIDERGLVNLLFNEFRKKVIDNGDVMDKIKNERKNLLDVIILASIIQGETNIKEEMPLVSGVYHNRIKKNMKLEADPTIQYILPDGPKPKLKYSDLKIDSPYNTYKYRGLPPGPINNPGLSAIKSSIEPDKNNFLFFVATGNGGHKFSETYQEHLKAVEEYKRNLEKKNE